MPRTCQHCNGPLDLLKPGRVPKYCSTRCRVAGNRATIPAEMRNMNRWVRWTPSKRPTGTTKRPIQLDGNPASSTDPTTWASYAQIRAHKRKGFVLGEGIGCIDLDHCLTADGKPIPEAAEFLKKIPRTYIEISPSGDGLHIFGHIPEQSGTKRVINGLHIERYSQGRFMTVTGNHYAGSTSKLADLNGL